MAYRRLPQDPPLQEDLEAPLDVEVLLRMSPEVNGQDLPQLAARHLLVSVMKSQPSVRAAFFADRKAHCCEDLVCPDWFDFEEFAILFVCQAIIELNDSHGIRDMLDVERVFGDLDEIYRSSNWKKLGE